MKKIQTIPGGRGDTARPCSLASWSHPLRLRRVGRPAGVPNKTTRVSKGSSRPRSWASQSSSATNTATSYQAPFEPGERASGDAAADDRRMRERQILAYPDRLLGRADDKLGKRPDPRHLVDWLAVKFHARRVVV